MFIIISSAYEHVLSFSFKRQRVEVSLVLRVSGQETSICLEFKLDKNWFMLEMKTFCP